MSAYWLQFIRTGNPNVTGQPRWESYKTGVVLEIGDSISQKKNSYKELLEAITARDL
jgi:carboxylesterase type B